MTIVAVWYEIKDQMIWCATDSLISGPQRTPVSGALKLTDLGAKTFPIEIACSQINSQPNMTRTPYARCVLGFTFAGSTLPALLTYSTASALLRNLTSLNLAAPPKMSEIAEYVSKVAREISAQILSAYNGSYGHFEAAIFGFCPQSKAPEAFHIAPQLTDTGYCFSITAHTHQKLSDSPLLLGSAKEAFLKSEASDTFTGRKPIKIIEKMIADGVEEVGGRVSLAGASLNSFELYMRAFPDNKGKAILSYNGLDLSSYMDVGDHYIGMFGMG